MSIFSPIQEKVHAIWQQTLAPRYDALAESEQRIVKFAAIFLPIIIFIFGIVLPVADKNAALKADIQKTSVLVAEANQLADQLAKNPQKQNATNSNLLSHVDNLARQTSVRTFMTRLRPQPALGGKQKLQTQIKDAPYKSVARFIAKLEESGLNITQMKIQSVSPGIVNVQATIGQ